MGGRERNACIKDKEGPALTTRLCFGYASPVDTAMVRRGLGGPNTLADSRLSFDGAAFLLAIRDGVVKRDPIRKSPILGRACGTSKDVPVSNVLVRQPASPRPPSWRMARGSQPYIGDSNVNRYL